MHDVPSNQVQHALQKFLQWVRTDLFSHDPSLRERAAGMPRGTISVAIDARVEPSKVVT